MKWKHLRFSINYSTVFINIYCSFKIEKKWKTWKICCLSSFRNYVILRGHILNISKTVFAKLIFCQRPQNLLSDGFFTKLLYTLFVCNKLFYLKNLQFDSIDFFFLRLRRFSKISTVKFGFSKKINFAYY